MRAWARRSGDPPGLAGVACHPASARFVDTTWNEVKFVTTVCETSFLGRDICWWLLTQQEPLSVFQTRLHVDTCILKNGNYSSALLFNPMAGVSGYCIHFRPWIRFETSVGWPSAWMWFCHSKKHRSVQQWGVNYSCRVNNKKTWSLVSTREIRSI